MKRLMPFVDYAVILDNSADGHTMVGFGKRGVMYWTDPLPDWVAAIQSGARIEPLTAGMAFSRESVFVLPQNS